MAKRKRRSPVQRWLEKQMDRPAVMETLERMAYSGFVSEVFLEKSPVLFWCLLPPMLIVLLLPMMLCLSIVGDTDTGNLLVLPVYAAWCFTSIPAGLGAVNLLMPLLQKLCEWRLRDEFPDGLEKPLYLGHGFTALFLLGLGGAAVILSFILTLF